MSSLRLWALVGTAKIPKEPRAFRSSLNLSEHRWEMGPRRALPFLLRSAPGRHCQASERCTALSLGKGDAGGHRCLMSCPSLFPVTSEAFSRRMGRVAMRIRGQEASRRFPAQRRGALQRPRSQNNVYSACPRRAPPPDQEGERKL